MKEQLSLLEKFLLWSSGANHRILAQEECLTERYKYAAIGMTVLLTSTIACFSGGYALFTAFSSLPASIIGGGFWGFTMFNLDRFFILSSKRKNNSSQLPFYTATALRLFIAILLSFVVAKPLELKLFENEINRELREEKVVENEKVELNKLEENIQRLKQEEEEKRTDWLEADKIANQEAEGTTGTGIIGKGNLYKEKKEKADILKQQFDKAERNVNQQQKAINELKQKINDILNDDLSKDEIKFGSFLDRLVALDKLAKEDKTIWDINLFITILFIIIETSPMLVKILSGKGSYDILLEQQETQGIYQEYLRNIKENELQKSGKILDYYLKSIMDFEHEIDKHKEKYLASKEKNRDNLSNRNIKNIRSNIDRQHAQEIQRFFEFCDGEMENYLRTISNEIKEHPNVIKNINQKIVNLEIDSVIKKLINQYHIEDNKVEKKDIDPNRLTQVPESVDL